MTDQPPPLPPLPPPPPRWCWQDVWLGLLAGSGVAGLACGALVLLSHSVDKEAVGPFIAVPSLFFLPLLSGLTASYFWRKFAPTFGKTAGLCAGLTGLSLVGATVFLREGIICLLMVSPILYVFTLAGAAVGRMWFRADPSNLRLSLMPLLLLATLAEPFTRASQPGVVTDEIVIRAPPAQVWRQITAFPDIPTPPRFWLFRLGLPYPMATTTTGNHVGADRRCIFSGNAVFKETVSGLVPERELTFDILEVPPDPELLGHLSPERGQFLLRDNGDGTTTLTGSTWYTLHVRPLWYFDRWTHHVFRAVHLRVMEDVKRRAEAEAPAAR